MSGTNPVFLVRKAKKSSDQKDAVLWCSDDFEAANATLDYLLIKSGAKLKDYFKAVATNFPVVNELPPEGELSLTFCDYYQLAKDNMTWTQIPGVTLPSSEAAAAARQHIVDGVDTETGEVLEDHNENFGNESNSPSPATAPAPELTVVATMPLRHRVLAQHIGEGEYLYHVDASQKKEILRLEMDTDNSYVQNLLLAAENVEAFKKAIEHDIHKAVNAYKQVFPVDGKVPELCTTIKFFKEWFSAEHINRGLLVKEWAERLKNKPAPVKKSEPHKVIVADVNKPERPRRSEKPTHRTINYELACGFCEELDLNNLRPAMDFAKRIIAEDREDWKRMSMTVGIIPDIKGYDRQTIIDLVHKAPKAVHNGNPDLRRTWCESFLAVHGVRDPDWYEYAPDNTPTTHEENAARLRQAGKCLRDIEAGRFQCDEEKPQSAGEGDLGTGKEAVTVEAETHQNNDSVSQSEPEAQQNVPESQQEEPEAAWPEYFEPGRYEGVPNEVYHAANGISSTQVKDARVSLMYFNARHVEKTIVKERSPVLDMGNLVHALALQPENLEAEFSVEPEIPEGAFTTTATLREFIDAHNASLPALLSADDIKALLEEYNATLSAPVPLGASLEETGQSYIALPAEYQRIEADQKQTAAAMKACIKEYNATLPTPVKTSGSRDALLEQLAIINPDLVAQEAQKSSPLKVSGTKAELIQAVKSVNPAAVFADELLDAWGENTEGKVLVTRQQLSTALNIQKALLGHPTAGKLLTHPSRAVEVSYFGFDEETGLEVRVRPDLEIDLDGVRIGADLKTISMWNIKQEGLRAKLHREIIDRDYHLSAAMYCETAALDQFFWIFVNKDENYHWVAIIEASTELLELGMLEYRKTMRAIANGFDTGEWPAPITEDYTDELNDFDVRRLEALRVQA
ncbi:exodeoxyribonuclease [Salmonella enterica subsp. salamae]|nr:exodeoxyribonuclease [Salmonella enterica subsp. salamae]SQH39491.1 exodeoxyribonuclease [Salmonella enterica]